MTYLEILQHQLPLDEGIRKKPYRDTVGKLTIGVGRNLDDVGVRDDEIALMLENDIPDAEAIVRGLVDFDALTEERKAVLVNMAFNMGRGLSAFAIMLRAVNDGRWNDAADAMLQSKWATQVGARATRLAAQMRGD